MTKKSFTIAGFLSTCAILLSACGGGPDDVVTPKPNPAPDPIPTPTPGTTPETPATISLQEYNETNLYKDIKIPEGNYSGITPLGNNLYAVTDDKLYGAGFVLMKLEMDGKKAKITAGERTIPTGTLLEYPVDTKDLNWDDPSSWPAAINDAEGIVYYKKNNTVFIACEEGHQGPRIVEYDLDGNATGREMEFPEGYRYYKDDNGQEQYNWNDGSFDLESLAYNEKTGLFWTTTEQSLRSDKVEGETSSLLRLQSFGENLKPAKQFFYQTDKTEKEGKSMHIWGVTDMLALDNGSLIVMEREVYYTWWQIKLFLVDPTKATAGDKLNKKLLISFSESSDRMLADYEGMCLGPKLDDGRQTVFLIADADNSKGGPTSLYNALKVLVME